MKCTPLFGSLALALSLSAYAATEVIPLNFRSAEELIPVVQSALGSEGRVSAYGNQLVVNAPTAKITEIRALLSQLDTQPRRLLISVDSNESSYRNDRGYAVDGSISSGSGRVEIGRGEVNGRDQARIIRRSTDSRGGGTQQVQTSEGYPALIQIGQSVPVVSSSRGPYGQVYQNTEYRNVTQGFYVTASLTGEVVHLQISSNRDRVSQSQPGVIDIQQADTRVSGRIGEWISIGGSSGQSQADRSGVLQRYSTEGRDDMSLRVKVDVLE